MNCSNKAVDLTKAKITNHIYLLIIIALIAVAISLSIIITLYKKFKKQFNQIVLNITQSPLIERNKNMTYILNRKILRQLSNEKDNESEKDKKEGPRKSSFHLQFPTPPTQSIEKPKSDSTPSKKVASKNSSASYFDIINSITYRAEDYFSPNGCMLYLPYIFSFIFLLTTFFIWWISLAINLVIEFGLGYVCHKSLLLPRTQFRPRNKITIYAVVSSFQLLWEIFQLFLMVLITAITFIVRNILDKASEGYGIGCFNMESIAQHLNTGFVGIGMLARMTKYNFAVGLMLLFATIPTIIIKLCFTILLPSHFIRLRIENIPSNT
jgi:hypothetical protein